MEQPVRVGLTFPRSGQQLYVQVPAHLAHTTTLQRFSEAAVRITIAVRPDPGKTGEPNPPRQ